jgi:hypothetical protein
MSSNYMPSQLPFLPGNTYADPTITKYHKTQLLGIKDGTITGKCAFAQYDARIEFITPVIYRENKEYSRKC